MPSLEWWRAESLVRNGRKELEIGIPLAPLTLDPGYPGHGMQHYASSPHCITRWPDCRILELILLKNTYHFPLPELSSENRIRQLILTSSIKKNTIDITSNKHKTR